MPKEILCGFGIDVDAVAGWLGSYGGEDSPDDISRGLFAGVTLNGSTIRQDRDANERFYGIAYRTRAITIERLGGSPEPSAAWREALARHAGGTS